MSCPFQQISHILTKNYITENVLNWNWFKVEKANLFMV